MNIYIINIANINIFSIINNFYRLIANISIFNINIINIYTLNIIIPNIRTLNTPSMS